VLAQKGRLWLRIADITAAARPKLTEPDPDRSHRSSTAGLEAAMDRQLQRSAPGDRQTTASSLLSAAFGLVAEPIVICFASHLRTKFAPPIRAG